MVSVVGYITNMWRNQAPTLSEEIKKPGAQSKGFPSLRNLFWWTYTKTVESWWSEKEECSTNSLNGRPSNPNPDISYRWFFSSKWNQGPWIAHDDELNDVIEDNFQEWMSDLHFIKYEGKLCVINFENFIQSIATEDAYDQRQLIRMSYE